MAVANAHTPGRPEFAAFEEPLTALATLTTPKGLAEKVREITDALDGDGGADRFYRDYLRRKVHLSKTLHGTWRLDGELDTEAGQVVAQAIQVVGGPQRKGDDRTSEQFRADALLDVCRLALKTRSQDPACAARGPTSRSC